MLQFFKSLMADFSPSTFLLGVVSDMVAAGILWGWGLLAFPEFRKWVAMVSGRSKNQIDDVKIEREVSFASNALALQAILDLRRDVFSQTISPDRTYWDCYKANRFVFKALYEDRQVVGYWGAAPVGAGVIARLASNQIDHAKILTSEIIPWPAEGSEISIYLIGIVRRLKGVPPKVGKIYTEALIGDMEQTFVELSKLYKIREIAGYPATPRGLSMMEKRLPRLGIAKTDALIGGNERSPLFRTSADFDQSKLSCQSQVVPVWADKEIFVREIRSIA